MDFNKLKNKCYGKSVEEIKNIINETDGFWKSDTNLLKLTLDASEYANEILNMDVEFPALFVYRKECKILLYILKDITNVELIPDNESFDDFDSFFKIALIELNSKAYFLNNMINQIIEESKNEVINEIYEIFSNKIPSVEDLEELKNSMKNIFSDESPEKLEKIENILAFNDPIMKEVKNAILNNQVANEIGKVKNAEENKEKVEEIDKTLSSAQKTADSILQSIKNTPEMKEIDNKIKEQQMKNIVEFSKQLEGKNK